MDNLEQEITNGLQRAYELIACDKGRESIPVLEFLLEKAIQTDNQTNAMPFITLLICQTLGAELEKAGEYGRALAILDPTAFAILTEHRDLFDRKSQLELPVLTGLILTAGRCHNAVNNCDRALALFSELRSAVEPRLSSDDPIMINIIDSIAHMLERMGRLTEAEEYLRQVVEIRDSKLGSDHPETIESRSLLAALHQEIQAHHYVTPERKSVINSHAENFRDALVVGDRSRAADVLHDFKMDIITSDRATFAESIRVLQDLTKECDVSGEVVLFVECTRAIFDSLDRVLGSTDTATIDALSNLAHAYCVAGLFDPAQCLAEECLDIRRTRLPPNDPAIATSLNNLSQIHYGAGRTEQAIELLEEALQIDRANLGAIHPTVAGDHHNIALAFEALGEFKRAEEHLLFAVDVWQKTFLDGHIHLATAYGNLGSLYRNMGDATAAILWLRAALDMFSSLGASKHQIASEITCLLADLEWEVLGCKRPGSGTPIYELEEKLGETHSMVLQQKKRSVLESGGLLANSVGIGISECYRLESNAENLMRAGNYVGAQDSLERAIKCAQRMGNNIPHRLAKLHGALSKVYTATSHFPAALEHMSHAVRYLTEAWDKQVYCVEFFDRVPLVNLGHKLLSQAFALWRDYLPNSVEAANLAVYAAFNLKELQSYVSARERNIARCNAGPVVQSKMSEIKQLKQHIIDQIQIAPGTEGVLSAATKIHQWQLRLHQIRKELVGSLPFEKAAPWVLENPAVRVSDVLDPGVGIVEFVEFTEGGSSQVDYLPVSIGLPSRLIAFLIRRNEPITWSDLGSTEDIAVIVMDLRRLIGVGRDDPGPRGRNNIPVHDSWENAALRLAERIIVPMKYLLDCEELVFAPSSCVAGLPFELLPISPGKRLLDSKVISYVSTAREVLQFRDIPQLSSNNPVVIADPNFDLVDESRILSRDTASALGVALSSPSLPAQLRRFRRLEGASKEAFTVSSLLNVKPLIDADAHRHALLTLNSPRILHLATHAFALASSYGAIDFSSSYVADMLDISSHPLGTLRPGLLHQFGIALAGANWKVNAVEKLIEFSDIKVPLSKSQERSVSQGNTSSDSSYRSSSRMTLEHVPFLKRQRDLAKKGLDHVLANDRGDDLLAMIKLPPNEAGNGIVTMDEIGWMNLDGTELVVLSACGTGLGIHLTGNEFLGLRNCFTLAGARTVVLSLWDIPDHETECLMVEFYTALLKGEKRSRALNSAKLALRRRFPEKPAIWAAFVCYGDSRPIPTRLNTGTA